MRFRCIVEENLALTQGEKKGALMDCKSAVTRMALRVMSINKGEKS